MNDKTWGNDSIAWNWGRTFLLRIFLVDQFPCTRLRHPATLSNKAFRSCRSASLETRWCSPKRRKIHKFRWQSRQRLSQNRRNCSLYVRWNAYRSLLSETQQVRFSLRYNQKKEPDIQKSKRIVYKQEKMSKGAEKEPYRNGRERLICSNLHYNVVETYVSKEGSSGSGSLMALWIFGLKIVLDLGPKREPR